MSQEDKIAEKIEELRQIMNQLMNKKDKLTDPEVVALSQKLDKLLNEYNDFIKKNK